MDNFVMPLRVHQRKGPHRNAFIQDTYVASARYPEIARTLTAAPGLLAALKAMMGNSEFRSIEIHLGESLPPMWTRICMPSPEALDLARAAIFKAEGEG